MFLGDEIRLGFLLLLNAAVFTSAWLATRRWARDPVQRLVDSLLLWFTVQYAAICIPGALHVLSNWTMALTALLMSGGMAWFGTRHPAASLQLAAHPPSDPNSDSHGAFPWVFLMAGIFVAAISGAVIYEQAYLPILDSDALTYHVPAAVHWIQTGRISLFPVWFFNPANTFSPLAGSAFIAWLMMPLGSDVLARAVQFPAVILLFLATLQWGRTVGLSNVIAALVAMAVAVSRPFNSELMSARDDIFLAAFIAVALAGCGRDALRDRFAPWRLGLAVGLAAATKYTFLFAAPVLLLVMDAPIKAGWKWRQWGIAVLTALLIAGPWYARNWLLTGNPLYPVDVNLFGHRLFTGLFDARRSERLSTWPAIKAALIFGFHAPPPILLAILLTGWLAAMIGLARQAVRNPLIRVCLFGLPLCLAIFLIRSPYSEVRFLFPALVPSFIAVGLAIQRWLRWPAVGIAVATVPPVVALATTYRYKLFPIVEEIVLIATLTTTGLLALIWTIGRVAVKYPRVKFLATTATLLVTGMLIYVQWQAYVEDCRASRFMSFQTQYGRSEPSWKFIAENVPDDSTLAYTNTYFAYPLYGPALQRRVIYVPVRADVPDFLHLPRFDKPVSGEQIEASFTHLLNEHPDRDTWVKHLLDSGATYLYIAGNTTGVEPPESRFADEDRARFNRIFQDPGGSVYRINR